jgi:hypothetical protein
MESHSKFISKFPKNIIFQTGFLLNCTKNVFFDLKSWRPLKNLKTRSGAYSGLSLFISVKNGIKISLN